MSLIQNYLKFKSKHHLEHMIKDTLENSSFFMKSRKLGTKLNKEPSFFLKKKMLNDS